MFSAYFFSGYVAVPWCCLHNHCVQHTCLGARATERKCWRFGSSHATTGGQFRQIPHCVASTQRYRQHSSFDVCLLPQFSGFHSRSCCRAKIRLLSCCHCDVRTSFLCGLRRLNTLLAHLRVIPLAIVGSHKFNNTLANFLGLLGYWSGAFAAIMTTEHLVFRRHDPKNYNIEAWNSPSRLPIGAAALFAGLAAFGIAVICMDQVWFVGPVAKTTGDIGFEVAVVAAGLLYVAARALEVRKQRRV